MSIFDMRQFWLNLNYTRFNSHDRAMWQWLVKQVVGSELLYSDQPNPTINPPNLNSSLTKSDASHDITCNVDFKVWSAIRSWSNGCEELMHIAYDRSQNTKLLMYFFINRASFLCFEHLSSSQFLSISL